MADIKFCMLLALSGTEIIDPGITEGGEVGRRGGGECSIRTVGKCIVMCEVVL